MPNFTGLSSWSCRSLSSTLKDTEGDASAAVAGAVVTPSVAVPASVVRASNAASVSRGASSVASPVSGCNPWKKDV